MSRYRAALEMISDMVSITERPDVHAVIAAALDGDPLPKWGPPIRCNHPTDQREQRQVHGESEFDGFTTEAFCNACRMYLA